MGSLVVGVWGATTVVAPEEIGSVEFANVNDGNDAVTIIESAVCFLNIALHSVNVPLVQIKPYVLQIPKKMRHIGCKQDGTVFGITAFEGTGDALAGIVKTSRSVTLELEAFQ